MKTNRQLRIEFVTEKKAGRLWSATNIILCKTIDEHLHSYINRIGPDVLDDTTDQSVIRKRLIEKNDELSDKVNFNNKIIVNNYDSINTGSHNYQTITNINDTNALIKKLETSNIFSIDLETTSLEIQTTQIIGISFSIKSHQVAYTPLY